MRFWPSVAPCESAALFQTTINKAILLCSLPGLFGKCQLSTYYIRCHGIPPCIYHDCCYDAMFSNNHNWKQDRKASREGVYMLQISKEITSNPTEQRHLKWVVVSQTGKDQENSRILLIDIQRKSFPAEKEWNAVHISRCIKNILNFYNILF